VRKLLGILALSVSALSIVPATAQGQDRTELLRQAQAAYDDFDPPRAIRIARSALDPVLGPLDSTWARGVHLLTQILVEEQQLPLARTWAQWAMRSNPDLPIDSVRFLANVVSLLREARAASALSSGDAGTTQRYTWPGAASDANDALFRLSPVAPPVTVVVTGRGVLGATGLALPVGTYELEISAPGFLPMRVTREALPGVTTEFTFALTPAAAAANTLAADVAARLARATIPLQVTRFGGPAACAVGVASGGERLVLTSYHAIRGADAIAANGEVRVAAWDVTSNLAVLMLPAAAPDTLSSATALTDGQALWGVALAECRTPTPTRVLLNTWDGRPLGTLALSAAPANAVIGSPMVDYRGQLAGVWTGAGRAAPATVIAPLIARARENIIAQRVLTPQQVAQQENHRYGTVIVAVDVPNATVRMTALEAWHWEELNANGPAPFTFRGAAGRYRLEVSAPGVAARTQEVVLRAGESTRTAVSLRAVAQGPAGPAPAARRGVPKWVWAVAIGGAVAGGLAMGGGGGGGGSSTGSINISVPNP
jgi:hypothetical protein